MRLIGLASSKGGVGKTTSAVHLSVSLAACGARVLLVDLDPQGAVSSTLGLSDPEADATSTCELAHDAAPQVQIHPEFPGLMVLGARPDVDHLQHAFAPGRLRQAALALQEPPDFVIVDLAPSMEPLTLWALNELDSVLLVVQPTALAIRTIPTMLANVTHHCAETAVEGLLINHMGVRGAYGEQVAQSLRESFGDWVFPVEIPFDEALQQAAMEGRTLWSSDSSSAEAFRLAAAELIERTWRASQVQAAPESIETEAEVSTGSLLGQWGEEESPVPAPAVGTRSLNRPAEPQPVESP